MPEIQGQTGSTSQDPRIASTRDYPSVRVPLEGYSEEIRAGEGNVDGIRGWIVVFGFTQERPDFARILVGHLDLRYPMRGSISHAVEGFDVSQGGAFFLPWVFVGLRFEHRSTDPAPHGDGFLELAVSFVPVLYDEPVPSGLGSLLYGRERRELLAEETEFDVPLGCTGYRALPASPFSEGSSLTVKEMSGAIEWARYTLDPNLPVAPHGSVGGCSWNSTPPGEQQARIVVSASHPGDHSAITVFWCFDLGRIR